MPSLPIDTAESDRISAILTRLGVASGQAIVVPLLGGLTNRNFRVESPAGVFVLRLGGAETGLMGIDRACEYAATAIAASLGVGAEVLLADAEADVLVTRFIAGVPLTSDQARTAVMLPRLAAALRQVHDGPAFPGLFAPWTATHRQLSHARQRGVAPPPAIDEALVCLAHIERSLGASTSLRPCHNDMLAANFLDDGERIRIIDWEYAGMGDPFFDLGNLAVNLDLDASDHPGLLRGYGLEPDDRALARLALMRLASDLREASWGYLQSAIATLDYDYLAYGDRHLARFLEGANHPTYSAWLDLAEG
jgi:thiamine kinase-like enzyme